MKKIILLLFVFLGFGLFYTPLSYAHFLETDKNIGAVLHADPNDSPIAGSQTAFFFEFKDKQGKFQPNNCDCTFSILENGNEVFSQPIFQTKQTSNPFAVSVYYTFP